MGRFFIKQEISINRTIIMRPLPLLLAWIGISFSQTFQPLFVLQRNFNANTVYYEARINDNGTIDAHDPVRIYWILWAKDSTGRTREELNVLEKNMAFGLNVRSDPKAKFLSVTIVAFPQRPITICMENGAAKAQTVIDGRASYLEKIYINSRETKILPKVNYIEIFGVDLKNGEHRYEKIIPK